MAKDSRDTEIVTNFGSRNSLLNSLWMYNRTGNFSHNSRRIKSKAYCVVNFDASLTDHDSWKLDFRKVGRCGLQRWRYLYIQLCYSSRKPFCVRYAYSQINDVYNFFWPHALLNPFLGVGTGLDYTCTPSIQYSIIFKRSNR
jgi:hypothetical protein